MLKEESTVRAQDVQEWLVDGQGERTRRWKPERVQEACNSCWGVGKERNRAVKDEVE